ncbi:hypothetical protein SAMN05660649_02874 [Desulfotomaculum arcticum]|uniref:Uncharacterized protein n=1 Tax=Desulfotruncus arcticus DSM 17038 TaxID=1121424 RepID=A0A1I2V968_9FIRM|nr:hypothetical protein [Desulfotruncus arcticus]SFG83691.1 hypothetical protein SAMN05660649_02874 [Desulfotomaculum arcticum] [Desulfotruncus arcticus DSM 17038]
MDQMEDLQQKLNQSLVTVRQAVDISANIKAANNPGSSSMVTAEWENFLKQFFSYVKKKSNETGHNLIAGISWSKIRP